MFRTFSLAQSSRVPEREANHSSPSSDEFMNEWSRTSMSPRCLMAWLFTNTASGKRTVSPHSDVSCSYVVPHTQASYMFLLSERLQTLHDRNNAGRGGGAIFFALLLFCLLTHNQQHCPQCTPGTDTLLTVEARYCLCTVTVATDLEAIAGAEPSGAPRVSLAFRVACNGV